MQQKNVYLQTFFLNALHDKHEAAEYTGEVYSAAWTASYLNEAGLYFIIS